MSLKMYQYLQESQKIAYRTVFYKEAGMLRHSGLKLYLHLITFTVHFISSSDIHCFFNHISYPSMNTYFPCPESQFYQKIVLSCKCLLMMYKIREQITCIQCADMMIADWSWMGWRPAMDECHKDVCCMSHRMWIFHTWYAFLHR